MQKVAIVDEAKLSLVMRVKLIHLANLIQFSLFRHVLYDRVMWQTKQEMRLKALKDANHRKAIIRNAREKAAYGQG